MQSSVAVALLLVGAACGQWNQPSWQQNGANTGVNTARQFQAQDGYGQASFGYSHPGQASVTYRDAQGNQAGSYAYIDPEGNEIRVNYVADSQGFRIVGNDQVAPAVAPVAAYQPMNTFIAETPEVAAARREHMAAHAAALARNTPAVQEQRWDDAPVAQQSWSAPAVKPSSAPIVAAQQTFLQDTPEVALAKQEFYRAYQQAALLAAENPE